jgi:hypothetical protein
MCLFVTRGKDKVVEEMCLVVWHESYKFRAQSIPLYPRVQSCRPAQHDGFETIFRSFGALTWQRIRGRVVFGTRELQLTEFVEVFTFTVGSKQ